MTEELFGSLSNRLKEKQMETKYRVVSCGNLVELENEVNLYLKGPWRLAGELVGESGTCAQKSYYQTLIRMSHEEWYRESDKAFDLEPIKKRLEERWWWQWRGGDRKVLNWVVPDVEALIAEVERLREQARNVAERARNSLEVEMGKDIITCQCDPDGWIRFANQHSRIGLWHGPFGVVYSTELSGWYEKCRKCNPKHEKRGMVLGETDNDFGIYGNARS